MTDQMVLQTQQWLNKTYGNDPRFKKINPDGRTGWPTIYALTRALQIELGIQSTADNFGPSTQRLFKKRYPNGVRQRAAADKSTSTCIPSFRGAVVQGLLHWWQHLTAFLRRNRFRDQEA